MNNLQSGKLIVIDGIDGSGKATQTKILVEKLKQTGHQVETMDFPQYKNNFFGQMIRQYLDGEFGEAIKINPKLASILYAADRWESSGKIKQWLADGKTVILDRYYTSNLIHQGAKLEENELDEFIAWLNKMEFDTFKIPQPDLVIYLHLDAELAHELIAKRGEGHDGHDKLEFMKLAEQRCLYLANKLNWKIIKCFKDNKILGIEKIAQQVELILKK